MSLLLISFCLLIGWINASTDAETPLAIVERNILKSLNDSSQNWAETAFPNDTHSAKEFHELIMNDYGSKFISKFHPIALSILSTNDSYLSKRSLKKDYMNALMSAAMDLHSSLLPYFIKHSYNPFVKDHPGIQILNAAYTPQLLFTKLKSSQDTLSRKLHSMYKQFHGNHHLVPRAWTPISFTTFLEGLRRVGFVAFWMIDRIGDFFLGTVLVSYALIGVAAAYFVVKHLLSPSPQMNQVE